MEKQSPNEIQGWLDCKDSDYCQGNNIVKNFGDLNETVTYTNLRIKSGETGSYNDFATITDR